VLGRPRHPWLQAILLGDIAMQAWYLPGQASSRSRGFRELLASCYDSAALFISIMNAGVQMKLSARNQLKGRVVEVKNGAVMSSVKLDIGGGNTITAFIGKESVEDLGLKVGDNAVAIIKSTEVIVGKE
jgi:molybdopterin-binding protein